MARLHLRGMLSLALVVCALPACADGARPADGSASQRSDYAAVDGGSALAVAGSAPGAIEAADGQWEWVEFPGAVCRDGSAAGVSVNLLAGATRAMLYLEGGGSCFDVETCAGNPAAVAFRAPAALGVFDRDNPDNPVRDWSFAYVPYCSGDLHAGDAADVAVDGVPGVQQFRGRPNLALFLERLVPTFAEVERVLLTGVSAGGLGAILDYDLVQRAFGEIPVVMIDDSGPVVSIDHVPACLNQFRRGYWGFDRSVIAACGEACDAEGDFMLQFVRRTLGSIAHGSGFIHSTQDEVIRSFYGIATNGGLDDCGGTLGQTPMEGPALEAALLDARQALRAASPAFSSFLVPGVQHGFLTNPTFYTQAVGGVALVDWFRDIVEARPARQVGP